MLSISVASMAEASKEDSIWRCELLGGVRDVHAFVMMLVVTDFILQMPGIDRKRDQVQLVSFEIDDQHSHPHSLGMDEDQGLLVLAGIANHPLPARTQLI